MKLSVHLFHLLFALFLALVSVPLQAQGGCTLGSVTLNVVPAPEPSISGDNQFCQGSSTTLSVTPSFNTYAWSTGGTGQSIDVNSPGTYTVTVTNNAGCTGTAAQTVTQSPAPTPTISAAPYQCNGEFTLDAGGGFSSYNWSTGGTNQTTTANTAGTYTVTVTNAVGCSGTATFDVTIPPPPSVSISGDNELCANGSGTLSATPGFSSYTWSTGGSGPSITINGAGTYTVTATDAFGCTDAASFTVTPVPAPTPTVSGPAGVCDGEPGTLTVTPSFPNYAWSTGEGTPSIIVTTADNYTVTVTDATGCTGTASFNLNVNPVPVPTISTAPYQCNGEFVLNGGGGFSTYNWSTGQSGNPITVNADGPYSVTVTSVNGCTGSTSININIPPPPSVSISGDNQICSNSSGTLTATPGFITYTWSTGGNGQSISVFNAGTYTVTATDAFGCTDAASFSVSVSPAPVPTISGPQAICANESGTLSVNQNFPNYSWSTGEGTQSIDVNTADTYAVTVTDANGCTGTASFNLTVNPSPTPSISEGQYLCNGQITLNGGGGFSSYTWSTGQTGNPITVNADGTYSVTVTSANGCTGSASINITIPPPPSVSISGDNQFCQGNNSLLEATPGLNSYVWSTGQTGSSITVFNAGTYTVTATDGFGCTATDNFTVGILPAPVPTITGQNTICNGETTVFTVPGSFNTYVWSTGFVGPSITVGTAGTYEVTVTDFNGCTGTAAQVLTVLPAPQPNITAAPYACNGQLVLNAGNGFASYTWSTGQTGNPISVNTDGTYSVTVTSANGCSGTASFFADIPDAPIVGIAGNGQICQGSSTTLEATPGFGAYIWSTGQSGPNITVSTAGNYTVTATDGFGCTATAVLPVQVLPNPTPTVAGPTSICAGGSATFSVPGSFSAYNWSTGESTQSITVSNGGTYTVTVTAANGCTGTAAQTLAISNSLEPQIAEQPYNCDGQIGLDAGAGFSTYAWSSGETTPTISVNVSGLYTVTVTDNTGCSGTDIVAVNIPDPPIVGIAGPPAICQNTAGQLEASPGFGIYVWSNGFVGQTINVTQAGTYTVTATDGFGCTAEAEYPVEVNPAPTTSVSGPSQICSNNSGTLSAAGNFPTYAWSTGASTQEIDVNAAGTYTVTVTNTFGCTGTAAQSVVVLTSLEPEIAALPYLCDGQIALDAGAGFATYLWSTGETTPTISVNATDDYTVTVTDASGCTGTDVVAVAIPDPPSVAVAGVADFCENTSTTLAATPGFVTYLWSTGDDTSDITVSATGNYGVTVTDALGCTATAALAATEQPLPTPQISGPAAICTNSDGTLSASGGFAAYLWSTGETSAAIIVSAADDYAVTVTDAFGCTGTAAQSVAVVTELEPEILAQPYLCDGQITLGTGAGFVTYLWSTGETTPTISVNATDDYTVTVTDASGCTGTDVVAVAIPDPPSVAVAGVADFCENTSTTLAATPGFVTYLWSTGDDTSDITVGATGNYGVTVTDALGCTATAALAATEQPLPTPQISGPAAICTNSDGTLSASGGFVAYLWSTGETSAAIIVSAADDYAVTVTDPFGCTGTAAQSVAVVTELEPEILTQPYLCDGQITLGTGAGFVTYLWSTGETTPTISVNTTDDYTVTVTDASGCTGTDVVAVTIPDPPSVAVAGVADFCENTSTTLAATPGFVTYLWSTGDDTSDITVSATGNYGVTVTDALGCTATAALAATEQPLPTPQISGPAAICTNSDGTLSASGGFAAYLWSTGETSAAITVSAADAYAVTVTDAFGCTGTAAQSVAVVTELEPEILAQPYLCDGQITLGTGAGFVTYLWSTGETTPTISVNTTDDYTVTVTDASGCTGTDVVAVAIPDPPSVAVAGVADFCENTSTTLAATPGFVTYLWSTGDATSDITVSATDNYGVTVTDALGCTATAALAATEQPLPTPQISGPAAICTNSDGTLSASGGFVAYLWSTGETSAAITVSAADDYAVTVTDPFGCTGTAAQSVAVVTELEPEILVQPYLCDGQITLGTGAGFATYLWSTGETTPTISVNATDDYTVTVTDASGCTGTDVVAVAIPDPPSVAVAGVADFCENTSTTLAATPGFVTYLWSTGDATSDIAVNTTGNYGVTVTDALGCTATAALAATEQPLPVAVLSGPTALCPGSSGTVTATASGPVLYSWSTGQNTSTISINNAGAYAVTVTDLLGCTGTAATTVLAATADTAFVQLSTCDPTNVGTSVQVFPGTGGCDSVVITQTTLIGVPIFGTTAVLSNFNGFAIACSDGTNGEAIATPATGMAPFSFAWSSGATTQVAQNLGAGNYTVTFTDALGCSGTAAVSLSAPPPVEPVIDATDPTCQNAGIIEVVQVTGGAGPYTVRLIQDIGTTNGTQPINFSTLDAGTFEIEVTDANGCKSTETVVLLPADIVEEFVSDTFEINKGDTVVLNAGAGITIQPLFITWTPASGLSCSNCLDPAIAPVRTTLVELDVAGFGGCRATGLFLIIVKSGGQIYAPNVIKPGSANDYGFTLFGDDRLVNIRRLQVYDRWGNHMANFENIVPNDPARGWDGRFRGQDMNPGVYVWWAEVEYSDGTTEILKGDVTVVR